MDFITTLFQQDMFFAVVSYLSIGLAFLLYFFYRERKWESDLARYQVNNVMPPDEAPKMRTAEIYVLNRSSGKMPVVASEIDDDEMQVIAGETMEPETMNPEKAVVVR